MADPKSQEEPSMEEILASIRRIISEDGETEDEGEAEAAAPEAVPAAEEPSDDEVLELTEVVDEGASENEADDADNVVALNQGEGAEPEAADEAQAVEAADEEAQEPPQADAPSEEPTAEEVADGLVSEGTEQSAAATLAQLAAGAVNQGGGNVSVAPGGRTIEDYVIEMLRPMLRDWLDQNLQGIVERLVQREIDRIGRRTDTK